MDIRSIVSSQNHPDVLEHSLRGFGGVNDDEQSDVISDGNVSRFSRGRAAVHSKSSEAGFGSSRSLVTPSRLGSPSDVWPVGIVELMLGGGANVHPVGGSPQKSPLH
jgi:hypothetical protein